MSVYRGQHGVDEPNRTECQQAYHNAELLTHGGTSAQGDPEAFTLSFGALLNLLLHSANRSASPCSQVHLAAPAVGSKGMYIQNHNSPGAPTNRSPCCKQGEGV